MINFFDNDMREIWASRDSGSTFPISRVYFESIQVWPSGTPPTPTGYTFSVIPTALTTDDSAKTVYFTVTTDSPQWLVNPSQSWITVNGITGGTVEIGIAANSGTTDRQGALAFSYRKSSTGGTGYVAVDVMQEGVIPVHNNIIHYTSTDSQVVVPYNTTGFGANIVSNTYYPDEGYGEIVFDGDVTSLGINAFRQCATLLSITIPESVTTIDESAFQSCANLSSVTIPDSVTTIGDYAFIGCYALSSFIIPDSVTTIGIGAFANCQALSSITIPDSVTTIADDTFNGCIALSSVTIPDSVTTIGIYAFNHCDALSSVTIPDSVTTIGESAFSRCGRLYLIFYNGTKAQWASVIKGSNWNYNTPAAVVHCSDGDTPI